MRAVLPGTVDIVIGKEWVQSSFPRLLPFYRPQTRGQDMVPDLRPRLAILRF